MNKESSVGASLGSGVVAGDATAAVSQQASGIKAGAGGDCSRWVSLS